MVKPHHVAEWEGSGIHQSLIELNLCCLEEEAIAEWYFQYLPKSARRNDGRIRDGYLRVYAEPLKGGWGIAGYDPTDWEAEPEYRCFKPDSPRIGFDGKPIKYDIAKNAKHNPILPRVSYAIASLVFRKAGLNFLELTQYFAPEEIIGRVEENDECRWFWQAIADNPTVPISLTEGAKKCLSLLSQGRCALAVTSITTWRAERGSNKLHPWLRVFTPKRSFYLTFDQDIKRKTIRAVDGQCVRLGAALIKAGASRVRRISWSGAAKGIDDFLAKLLEKYGDRATQKILGKCYKNARDYRRFSHSSRLPGHIKTVNKQYLSAKDLEFATGFKILVVKSAKGTGKTQVLSDLVASDRFRGTPTINLSYLERLARELGNRLDLPYRTEENTTSLRNSLGYSLCLDSLSPENSIPFHAQQWSDAGLIIDEFTQVLYHLAFGMTEIKKYRKLILRELGQTRTRTQSAAFAKHQIKQRYGVESVSCELVEAERQKLYPVLRLRFWLTVGRGYLEDSERTLVEKQKESNHGSLFLPDLNNLCSITKVKFLELLDSKVNFLKRINQLGGEWSNKSPLLIELKNFVLKDLVRCNQVLRCGIAKTDSPITVAQKILKVIGMKLPYLRNERDGRKRLRIYGVAISKFGELHHQLNQILDNWLLEASSAVYNLHNSQAAKDRA